MAAAAAKWADENPALVTSILAVAGALVAFKLGAAAIGVARTAMLAIKLAVSANPVGLMVRLMVVACAMIYANWDGIVSGLNARSETVASLASFKNARAKGRHCIVPCEAIYEPDWRTGTQIPTRFTATEDGTLGVAGLWPPWRAPTGEWIDTFTMSTPASIR